MKCKADPACVWPADDSGLCAQHLKDKQLQFSLLGSTMQQFEGLETYDWKAKYGSISRKAAAQ